MKTQMPREGHATTEAGSRGREGFSRHRGWLATTRSLGRDEGVFLPYRFRRKHTPLSPCFLTWGLRSCGPPSFGGRWYFVTAEAGTAGDVVPGGRTSGAAKGDKPHEAS